jgi:hypothetical protein
MARRRSVERERYWRSIIAEQESSGQSISDFCRQREVAQGSFFNWRRKFAIAEKDTGKIDVAANFLPIELPPLPTEAGRSSFEVVLPDGYRVVLPPHSDCQLLCEVLDAVRQRSC